MRGEAMDAQLTAWETWKEKWQTCQRCPLGALAHRHVLGTGPRSSPILLVGEGPGRSEDVLGEPFVGRAGKLLNRMLEDAGLQRNQLFITNLVACRPCNGTYEPNRPPTDNELSQCAPRLEELARMLQPKLVILVGRTAQRFAHPLLETMKGAWVYLFLIHPAALLRQGGVNAPQYSKAVADLATVRAVL